jgi:FixJ family two-component response regulator
MSTGDFVLYLIDDDPSVRKSLSRLLGSKGYTVVAYASGRDFLQAQNSDVSGCLILDMSMPDMNGLEIQQELADRNIEWPIIFVSGIAEVPESVKALKKGAIDFLTKPVKAKELVDAIATAQVWQEEERQRRAESLDRSVRIGQLSMRERQVFDCVVSGMLNKLIAYRLGLSLKTVKLYRGRMMKKMNVRSVADLVRISMDGRAAV